MKKIIAVFIVIFVVCSLSYFAINQLLSIEIGMNEIISTPIVNDTSKISEKYKVKIEIKPAKSVEINEQKVISEVGIVEIIDDEK